MARVTNLPVAAPSDVDANDLVWLTDTNGAAKDKRLTIGVLEARVAQNLPTDGPGGFVTLDADGNLPPLSDLGVGAAGEGQIAVVRDGVWAFEAKPTGGGGGGNGDVTGPTSATNNELVLFDQASGKAVKGAGYTPTTLPISEPTQAALTAKAPLASPTFTGTVSGITAAMVGLGSVSNTADADKPVSTATQTALDAKAPSASPTFTGAVTVPDATFANAKLANMAAARIKGRSSGTGAPEDLTPEQVLTLLGAAPVAAASTIAILAGLSGDRFFDPSLYAAAFSPASLGEPEAATLTYDGSVRLTQTVTITQATTLAGAMNCQPGREYALTVVCGSGGPYVLTLAAGGWRLPESFDGPAISIGVGEAVKLWFSKDGPAVQALVSRREVYPVPGNIAPTILRSAITPAVGSGVGQVFASSHESTGVPAATATYAWYVNGDLDAGATSPSYTPAVDGSYRRTVTVDNGVGSPAVASSYARTGRAQPTPVGQGTVISESAAITDGVLTFAGIGDFTPQAGDFLLWGAAQQNGTSNTGLPTGVTYLGSEIPRPSDATVNLNYRTALAYKWLAAEDITAGGISGITVRGSSMVSALILRGVAAVGGVQWDGTASRDTVTPFLEHNSVVAPTATALYPALSCVLVTGGHYNLNVKAVANAGWTGGATATFASDNGRYGARWLWRQSPSGLVTPGTFAHGNTADKHLTACTLLVYGPAD